jgi:hypothetical protein
VDGTPVGRGAGGERAASHDQRAKAGAHSVAAFGSVAAEAAVPHRVRPAAADAATDRFLEGVEAHLSFRRFIYR